MQSAEKSGQKSGEKSGGKRDDEQSTFETDISESDEEGTTVRQAEVREDDLSEVKPSASGQKH
ncbi:hypothetical protein C7H84_21795 [Burkholderia sp. Nafp2/4-1b]|uniref:hypothetical protein n=1 Tax=Burkholderia sp. Nafp2/4-1b TaxID=2116686 RepID=UPI000EF86F07|nr:hypothetical protein [Burkholderia sp. Nafp2/4-1b]RKU01300.1 hypothetical protein C7H84_21795 [Burkholderia sp. Nafp2/4-1b]